MMVNWESKYICELADIVSGGTPQTNISEYWDGDIIWIVPTDITKQHEKYLASSERKITQLGLVNSAAILLPKGTILLCSRATIGELAIASQPVATNQGFKNLVCFEGTDNEFLYYAIQPLKAKMIELASGSTFLEISKAALGKIKVLIPPLPEQRHIATVLSDTDLLITTLEKLIAKKRAIKQGAMQELLTGKRRLPGFQGEWVQKPLGELFDISGGISASRSQLSIVGYPYLHYGDIHGATQTFIDVCADSTIPCLDVPLNKVSNRSLLQDGDVVFVDASEEDEGSSRHIVVRNTECKPFISGLHTIVAKAKNDELDNQYREYCFQTEAIKTQFKFYAVGTKVMGVSKTTIKDINLLFPVSLTEQAAIASILSDMDAEIDALTMKLTKLKAIKQGMMSELLTGRIRLVEQESNTNG